MKVAIIGSRNFSNYQLMEDAINLLNINISTVVSGGADGADILAEKYAKKNKKQLKIFPAEWEKYGKKAGFLRNKFIIEESSIVIAFWDGESKGTGNSLSIAKKLKKPTFIFYF